VSTYRTEADLTKLSDIRDHVFARAREAGLTPLLEPKLELVLEEIMVNVANYAYGDGKGLAEIDCTSTPGVFCVTIRDWGTPFNPLEVDESNLSTDIDERAIGGVGLLLVTTMSDSCSYARKNDANELTFCFSL